RAAGGGRRGTLPGAGQLRPPHRPLRRDHGDARGRASRARHGARLSLSRYAAFVSPCRSAYITRPTRSRTPSFWKMLVRWVFTVRSLIVRVAPTSLFL